MKHIRDGQYAMADTCVALGYFDGMHTGHQAVIDKLTETAAAKGLSAVLLSYDRDDTKTEKLLTTEEEKVYLLGAKPVEAVVSIAVDGADPLDEAFIKEVLVDKLGAKAVVVGKNFDKLETLRAGAEKHGYSVVECELVTDGGQPVSGERIAKALVACELDTARSLLGYPYLVIGKVVPGKQLGRTVGQPTANIDFSQNKQLPPDGSYATITLVDGKRRVGLTNIGKRPTVDTFDYTTIENHILDFSGDLYGKQLPLEIHRFVRGVQKFNGLDEVKAQVAKDIASIRSYLDSMQ